MNFYAGKRVITNINLFVAGNPYEVRRTWKERLFSKPWKPLRKTRTVVPMVPSREIYCTNDCIIMHPAIIDKEYGIPCKLSESDIKFFQGVAASGYEDAQEIVDAIIEYGEIEIFTRS